MTSGAEITSAAQATETVADELSDLERLIELGNIEDARKLVERINLVFPDRGSLPQHVRELIDGVDAEWQLVRRMLDAAKASCDELEIVKPPQVHPYGVSVHRRKLPQKSAHLYRAEATYSNVTSLDFVRICCLLLESEGLAKWFPTKFLKSNHVLATPTRYSRRMHTVFSTGRDAVLGLNFYYLPQRDGYLFTVKSLEESNSLHFPPKANGVVRLDLEVGFYMRLEAKNTFRFSLMVGEYADSASASYQQNLAEALEYFRKAVHLCPGTELESNITNTKKQGFYTDIVATLKEVDRKVSNQAPPSSSRREVDFHSFSMKNPTYLVARILTILCLGGLIADQYLGSKWTGDRGIWLAPCATFVYVIAEVAFQAIIRLKEKKRHDRSVVHVKPIKSANAKKNQTAAKRKDAASSTLRNESKETAIESHGFGVAEKVVDVHPSIGVRAKFRSINIIRKVRKSRRKKQKSRREKDLFENRIKMLLLGAGESGKSTVFKQMRLLYGAPPNKNDLDIYKTIIRSNAMVAMKKLVLLLRSLKLESELAIESENTGSEHGLQHGFEDVCRRVDAGERSWQTQDPTITEASPNAKEFLQCAKSLQAIWQSDVIKQAWTKRSDMNVVDSHKEYLGDIPRIAADNYEPTIQDILLARVRTTQATTEKYIIDGSMFQLVDVGGQRLERRTWTSHFDSADAVIFVAALSEYDQKLAEARESNRMVEALELFRSICGNSDFATTPILLFLNKKDLLEEKILVSNIADQPAFTDYVGPEKSFEHGVDYFRQKFMDCLEDRPEDEFFVHVTCATNTQNMEFVLASTRKFIVQGNLKQSGIMD